MILDATTKKLQVILSGAITTNQLPVVASWVDTVSGGTFVPGEADTATNSTTAVDIVASPAASTQRQVQEINIRNTDTAAATVLVRYNNNATIRELFKATLAVGDQMQYGKDGYWRVFDSSGNLKTIETGFSAVTANTVFAGATSGGSALPAFRALVAADIPNLSATYLPLAGGTLTGPLGLPNGSAATPAVTWGTDVGFWHTTGNVFLGFSSTLGTAYSWTATQFACPSINGSFTPTVFAAVASPNFFSCGAPGDAGGTSVVTLLGFDATLTGTVAASFLIGISGAARNVGTGLLGTARGASFTARSNNTGGVTTATGVVAQVLSTASGFITTAEGMRIAQPVASVGSPITTSYGLRIDTQAGTGITTAWALAVAGTSDNSYIAGKLSVGKSTAPAQAIDVTGNVVTTGVMTAGYQRITPATGFSQTISDNVAALVIKPAGLLATGTITMAANPLDGQVIIIETSQTITTLTHNPNSGQTLNGALTTLTANTSASWQWIATDSTWFRR